MDQSALARAIVASLRCSGMFIARMIYDGRSEKSRRRAARFFPPVRLLTSGVATASPHPLPAAPEASAAGLRERVAGLRTVFREAPGALRLVWQADAPGAIAIGALTVGLALLPAGIAWVGKLIVDGVVAAARSGAPARRARPGVGRVRSPRGGPRPWGSPGRRTDWT